MSEGSRKEVTVTEDDAKKIEARMRRAEYGCRVNYMEACFSEDKVKESDDGNSGATGEGSSTAGSHTIVGENGSVSFVGKIPDIAQGPSTKLKDAKDAKKDKLGTKDERKR